MDEFQNDTSFDTLNSENLFLTYTEDQFGISKTNGNVLSKNTSEVGDDSMIEHELKKINQNLNTFTVEHFNNLRQQI